MGGWGEPKDSIVEITRRDLNSYSELTAAAREFIRRGTTGNRERLIAAVDALDEVQERT